VRLLSKLVAGGGIAAFFFFAWIIQILWNSLVVGHLGLLKPLTYLEAAGLWFLVILLTAWAGLGVGTRFLLRARGDRGRRAQLLLGRGFLRWIGLGPKIEWQNQDERMEERIRKRFSEWTKED